MGWLSNLNPFKSSDPPPAPDFGGLAQQQGQANQQAAITNANLNRVNQVGPGGSVSWTIRPGADPNNPQAGDWTQTTSLDPTQQGLYDSSNRLSQQYANTAEMGMGRLGRTMGQDFNPQGLQQLQGAPQAGPVQGQVQTGQLPELGGDYEASRKAVVDAMLSRTQPQMEQNRSAAENRLLNSGIEKGSEAWNREMANLGQQENDMRMQAELAGGAEQSRLRGLAAGERGQLYGEGLSSGNFANTAQNQAFTQGLAGAQFGNQARAQGFQEQLTQRQLPLNEMNALRSGAQVQTPQFSSYYTGANTQAAPIFDAGLAQGNYNTQAYGTRQSGQNALLGGLANMGAVWLGS